MLFSSKKEAEKARQMAVETAAAIQQGVENLAREIVAAKDTTDAGESFATLIKIKEKIRSFQAEIECKISEQQEELPVSYTKAFFQKWGGWGGGATAIGAFPAIFVIGATGPAAIPIGMSILGSAMILSSLYSSNSATKKTQHAYNTNIEGSLQPLSMLLQEATTEAQSVFNKFIKESAQKLSSLQNTPDAGERYNVLITLERKIGEYSKLSTDLPDTSSLLQDLQARKKDILKDDIAALAASPFFDDLYDNVPEVKDAFIKAAAREKLTAPRIFRLDKPSWRPSPN